MSWLGLSLILVVDMTSYFLVTCFVLQKRKLFLSYRHTRRSMKNSLCNFSSSVDGIYTNHPTYQRMNDCSWQRTGTHIKDMPPCVAGCLSADWAIFLAFTHGLP